MKRNFRVFFSFLLFSAVAAAQEEGLKISVQFDDPDRIATNIRKECDLPKHQAVLLIEELKQVGVKAELIETPKAPVPGRYLMVDIKDAVSMGNAFLGHKKFVLTSAKLFLNGQEVAKSSFNRNSMGGAFAGFKGSCMVLDRCVETISKDMAGWVKMNLGLLPEAAKKVE